MKTLKRIRIEGIEICPVKTVEQAIHEAVLTLPHKDRIIYRLRARFRNPRSKDIIAREARLIFSLRWVYLSPETEVFRVRLIDLQQRKLLKI